jgi:hypothetical protein
MEMPLRRNVVLRRNVRHKSPVLRYLSAQLIIILLIGFGLGRIIYDFAYFCFYASVSAMLLGFIVGALVVLILSVREHGHLIDEIESLRADDNVLTRREIERELWLRYKKIYDAVFLHRMVCEKWKSGKNCSQCFGGGLHAFFLKLMGGKNEKRN